MVPFPLHSFAPTFIFLGLSTTAPAGVPPTRLIPFNTTYNIALASEGFFQEISGEIQGYSAEVDLFFLDHL